MTCFDPIFCLNFFLSFFFIFYTYLNYFLIPAFFLKGEFHLINWSATQYYFLTWGGGKVSQLKKNLQGREANFRFWLTRGGGRDWTPPFWLTSYVNSLFSCLICFDIILEFIFEYIYFFSFVFFFSVLTHICSVLPNVSSRGGQVSGAYKQIQKY